ncbi:MAG: YncE family protein [Dysgonamonadaceae bacterium]|jgi:DNA-binding beta-propeller fold protein YncE|nr:YncE family protein [Dysgonamonadaceae bacterium]
MKRFLYAIFALSVILAASCRGDVEMILSEDISVSNPETIKGYKGFYLLNEGNMGSNKATLDYYNFATGIYKRNIYAEVNPSVPKELGDVGNDIGIYGDKLYAVINCSNKIEVMDAETTRRIGQIEIPNCRFIKFHEGYAYITSYAGPVIIDPHYEQIGFVAKINTSTLQEVARCLVGFQPDELEIAGGKIYVVNSGGYMGAGGTSGYERTVSVIDIESFREERRIDVAYNLERIKADSRGDLWISSRGDYEGLPASLFFLDREKGEITDTIPIAATNYWIDDDLLYVYGTEWSNIDNDWNISYRVVDTRTHEITARKIIADGTDKEIEKPYGIMVHPETKDVFITDAGNYVTPGAVYCFDKNGKKKWSVRAGNIPGHFALLPIYE